MFKYIIKRILYLIPILFGVTIIIFALKTFTPGDPARQILGNKRFGRTGTGKERRVRPE